MHKYTQVIRDLRMVADALDELNMPKEASIADEVMVKTAQSLNTTSLMGQGSESVSGTGSAGSPANMLTQGLGAQLTGVGDRAMTGLLETQKPELRLRFWSKVLGTKAGKLAQWLGVSPLQRAQIGGADDIYQTVTEMSPYGSAAMNATKGQEATSSEGLGKGTLTTEKIDKIMGNVYKRTMQTLQGQGKNTQKELTEDELRKMIQEEMRNT